MEEEKDVHWVLLTTGKDAKKVVLSRQMFTCTQIFNIDANDYGVKKSARCKLVFVVTELVVSRG